MNRVLVETAIRSRLHGLDSELEFCDESGHTLGYFVPSSEADPGLYAWARAAFSDEEIEQARGESGGRTTAEVLSRLAGR